MSDRERGKRDPEAVVEIKRLPHSHGAPVFMTEGSAGMDIPAAIEEALLLEPGQRTLVPSGFAIAIPRGYEGQVRPRSGLALKQGICVANSPGTIDSDYRGEVKVILANLGDETVCIEPGPRISQLVICPVPRCVLRGVGGPDATARGAGG